MKKGAICRCRVRVPESFETIRCAWCKNKTIRANADHWLELEGDVYCPDCVEKLKNAAGGE